LLYHVCAVASLNIRFARCGTSGKLTLWTCLVFVDEAQFTRDELQNCHIQRMWADENSYVILSSYEQQRFSNIWAGICGNNLFGPHVLPNRLTGWNLQSFLGKQPTCTVQSRYLNWKFPGQRTGKGRPVAWPPRSPDLNPLRFCPWGHANRSLCPSPMADAEMFWNRIMAGFFFLHNSQHDKNLRSSSGGNETLNWGLYLGWGCQRWAIETRKLCISGPMLI
jgi:hypothetical protein